jgi:hypothetical protein
MKKFDFTQEWLFYKKDNQEKTSINLPHDAMMSEKRQPDCASGSAGAFFPGGLYFYEKTFTVPQEWQDKNLLLAFEGVYRNATVRVNNQIVGTNAYGYVPFTVVLDEFVKCGTENLIQVEVDNSQIPNSRWYTGSGIYRPVWLYVGEQSHIAYEGVRITTVSYNPAKIRVETDHTGGEVDVEIMYQGKIVATGAGDSIELLIPDAKLWSADSPELYQCVVRLKTDDIIVDQVVENFGIRKIEWNKNGLFINGLETLLRGGCVHHDNGILGARSYAETEERRVRILKETGYNAIRSSHNPASPAMIAACDKYGMYLIDETWDTWYSPKNIYDYSCQFEQNYEKDIQAMVSRDYNHPSVIMYSIGNEVTEPGEEKGLALERKMIDLIKSLDQSRAVSAGLNLFLINRASKGQGIYKDVGKEDEAKKKAQDKDKKKLSGSLFFNVVTSMVGTFMNQAANSKSADKVTSPSLDMLDIAGYNYASGRYKLEAEAHPDRVIVGSETFPQDIAKNWAMVRKYPYLIGDFMWTAWDYLGEAGMGSWSYDKNIGGFEKPFPYILAEGGAIDILGDVGAQAEYAAVVWGLRIKPYIAVRPVNHPGVRPNKAVWRGTNALPSWSWHDCEGNKAEIEVYSNAAKIKLMLDEKLVGIKKTKDCKVMFKAKYKPGKLTAIACDESGREISRSQLESAKGKLMITIAPEQENIFKSDVFYVNVNVTDENGVIESNADCKLTISVAGGELLAYGSANPRTEESYLNGEFTTWYGRSQAVIKAGTDEFITIRVSSNEFANKSLKIKLK